MGFFKKMMSGVDTDLLANGVPGQGLILSVTPSGSTVQMGNGLVERSCQFQVQVTLDNVPPYTTTVKQRVPEVYLSQFVPGSTVVAVKANQADHSQIALDFNSAPPEVTVARDPNKSSAAQILESGTPARAVIVQNQALGMKNADGVDMQGFLLTVMPEGAQPYQVKVGNPTPPEALPLLYPGSKVPVKIGAGSPNDVVIDWQAALAEGGSA